MTQGWDSPTWEERFPLRTAGPHTCEHLGIVYRGQVVRAEKWSSQWAEQLTGDAYYRIVLLQERPPGELSAPPDGRTAVCLPSSGDRRRLDRLIDELKTVDQAAYLTRRSADAATVGQSLQQRRRALNEGILAEWCSRFADGEILSGAVSLPGPSRVFSDSDPWGWLDRLAASLLAAAYPKLPVNTAHIGAPLHSEDAAGIFSGAFGHSEASTGIFRRLGPPLGLSSPSDPVRLDPTNCRVFDLLQRKLQDAPQPAGFQNIHHHLAHDVGLTESLSTLFLLLFVYWEQLEVRLNGARELTLADGRSLLASRLTSDIVPSLAWNDRLAESLATLEPVSPPHWQDALHHLAALCPEIRDGLAGDGRAVLEPRLLSKTESLQCRVQSSLDLLETFRDAPCATTEGSSSRQEPTETGALFSSLSRLSHISGDGFEAIYLAIRSTYRDFSLFERDLEDLARISELSGQAEEIRTAHIFMAGASVPPSRFPVLAVDREALLNAASPATLVQSRGRGWPAVATDLESFRARFSSVYREHHQWFYQVLPAYQRDLEAARRKLKAVELFNTLPKLGLPSGDGLVEELSRLPDGPPRCSIPLADLEVATSPRCAACGLSLEDTLPVDELARLTPAIEDALSDKTRSLSSQLVGKVLHGATGSQFDEFLRIVQASELTALSNTLDPELLAFIQSVLD